jgi:Xaa-Pro aminopeptidase
MAASSHRIKGQGCAQHEKSFIEFFRHLAMLIDMSGFGNFGLADFPKNEFETRWKKAQNLMNQSGIDALYLSHWGNIAYFSGFRQTYYHDVCYIFVLPREGHPVLVSPISMRGNLENMTWMGDIKYFGKDVGGSAEETLTRLFKSLSFPNKTIGVENEGVALGGGMMNYAPRILETATKPVPGLKFVDCSDLVWKLRKIKSSLEMGYIKKSVDICTKAFRAGLESLKEGMTEREYARVVYKAMLDEGSTDSPLFETLNCRAGSDRYTHFDTRPTDRKIGRGEIVMLDGGTTYRGYWSDLTRQACIGEPSKKQRTLYDAAQKATEAAVDAIKPGVTINEVCSSSLDTVRNSGLGKYLISEGVGHALGLSIHEPPWIRAGINEKLEPGMVLALEPTLYDTPVAEYLRYKPNATGLGGEGIFAVEDNVLVTQSGHEVLNSIPRDLWIVR